MACPRQEKAWVRGIVGRALGFFHFSAPIGQYLVCILLLDVIITCSNRWPDGSMANFEQRNWRIVHS